MSSFFRRFRAWHTPLPNPADYSPPPRLTPRRFIKVWRAAAAVRRNGEMPSAAQHEAEATATRGEASQSPPSSPHPAPIAPSSSPAEALDDARLVARGAAVRTSQAYATHAPPLLAFLRRRVQLYRAAVGEFVIGYRESVQVSGEEEEAERARLAEIADAVRGMDLEKGGSALLRMGEEVLEKGGADVRRAREEVAKARSGISRGDGEDGKHRSA